MSNNRKPVTLKVLGSAQDAGIPQLGRYNANSNAARKDPSLRRYAVCLGLYNPNNNKRYIIEATPDLREQVDLLNQELPQENLPALPAIDGVLLTHAHMGHYTGLMFLGFESANTKETPVWCTKSMGDYLSTNGPWSQLVEFKNIALNEITYDTEFTIDEDIKATAIHVPHREEYSDAVGFILNIHDQKVLFIPDVDRWDVWDTKIEELVSEMDYAFLDGTFYSLDEIKARDYTKVRHPLIEMSMERMQQVADAGKTKIHFIHFNNTSLVLSDPKVKQSILDHGFYVAEEGMRFSL